MNKLRVLLANRPRMLRETLESLLERQLDLEVVAVDPDPVELLAAVERTEPDVVVLSAGENGTDPGICSVLLAEYPQLLIIAVSPQAQHADLYRQVITKERLVPLSSASLLAVIRDLSETTAEGLHRDDPSVFDL